MREEKSIAASHVNDIYTLFQNNFIPLVRVVVCHID